MKIIITNETTKRSSILIGTPRYIFAGETIRIDLYPQFRDMFVDELNDNKENLKRIRFDTSKSENFYADVNNKILYLHIPKGFSMNILFE